VPFPKITLPQWSRSGGTALPKTVTKEELMFQKIVTVTLVGTALVLAACNTVRGAAKDVNSVANCTENTMNGNGCH
jgi:predicted small secreted protein